MLQPTLQVTGKSGQCIFLPATTTLTIITIREEGTILTQMTVMAVCIITHRVVTLEHITKRTMLINILIQQQLVLFMEELSIFMRADMTVMPMQGMVIQDTRMVMQTDMT